MAVDAFLIITILVIAVVLLIGIALSIVYMQHPDDKNVAWLPKGVVLFGLFLACCNVLILPLDVMDAQNGGGLNMNLVWTISFYMTAVMVLIIIPFAYFYYENETDSGESTAGCCGLIPYWNSQLCEGIKWSLAFFISFSLILVIMYALLPYADIPLTTRTYDFTSSTLRVTTAVPDLDELDVDCSSDADTAAQTHDCFVSSSVIELQITFPVYCMALLAFVGWFLFVLFAGMGLPALPWDLFNEWRFRPKPMDLSKYATEKKSLGKRAELLKKAGEAIKSDELNNMGAKLSRKEKREFGQTLNRFESAVFLIKRDYYHLETSYKHRGGNPVLYWVKLVLAILGASMSLMWLIHICVYILPNEPVHPFLNNLFIGLTVPGFPLFGVLAFSFYSFWLLLCVIKGNFRFGLRIACCRVFPMEFQNTLMNSFLANTWLILMSSIVVTQFCALSFPVYARNTQIDLLFGTQIRYLRFFTYFFDNNVFVWILLISALIAACWVFLCPKNEANRIEKELDDIMKGKKNINKKDLQLVSKR
mmetsp:Transcript_24368/g.39232  ORF Transcript_24368/g.39232 Transcript_24368/m.39232 type:complete len:534 (+) Transcript_24368:160-1761(+)